MKFYKEYVWVLFEIHKDKLTIVQKRCIELFLDSFELKKADRRWTYAALHRLYSIETGISERSAKNKFL
jgi:hypothetical protein